jgi:hypothetical protein
MSSLLRALLNENRSLTPSGIRDDRAFVGIVDCEDIRKSV